MALTVEEAQVGKRIRLIRKEHGVSQRLAAAQMGISRQRLDRIERGEVAVRVLGGLFFCQFADVNPLWLAFGEPEERVGFVGAQLSLPVGSEDSVGFLEAMQRNRVLFPSPPRETKASKKRLGSLSIKRYLIPEMTVEAPPSWDELRAKLVSKTETAKEKRDLARRLGVTLAAISQWRTGASAPTADKTLQILRWVEQSEVKQKKSAGSAVTRPALKTRERKAPSNAKPKSSQKKQ